MDQNHHELETAYNKISGQTARTMDEKHHTDSDGEMATSSNGPIKMEGARGGLHSAVDIKATKEEEDFIFCEFVYIAQYFILY